MKYLPQHKAIVINLQDLDLIYLNTMHAIKDLRNGFGISLGKRKIGENEALDNAERLLLHNLILIGIDPGAEWGHKLDLTNLEN